MPGRSYNKVEAKYNVTTDFPSLGLHSAAATGNLGLVEYALGNGQPINSVLDGVLPLHAACAGGHIQVVKLLIERGADVNAPRLPRRYSNDKNRDSSAPIVGSSGSTPLHFAAANGNTNVATLLLLHGAHADRPDKHGITPEKLAMQNGWLECAQVLRDWIMNKDRDLREREMSIPWDGSSAHRSSRSRDTLIGDAEPSSSPTHRRRLQVKHSIDTALNILKSSSSAFEGNKISLRKVPSTNSPPASPSKPCADPTVGPDSLAENGRMSPIPVDHGSRRPSLPHAFQAPPPRIRKTSNPSTNSPFFSTRRPRSAGTEAEREEEDVQPSALRNTTGRRLGSKYSLINMFKKAQSDVPSTPDVQSGTTTSLLSVPNKPVPDPKKDKETTSNIVPRAHRGSDASSRSQSYSSSPRSIDRRNLPSLDDVVQEEDIQPPSHQRILLEAREAARTSSSPISMLSSILRTKDNNRERSGSNGSSYSIQTNRHLSSIKDEAEGEGDSIKGITRPSILRSHTRSSSSGQGTPLSSSYRALRFEYSPNDTDHTEVPRGLRSVNSAGALARSHAQQRDGGQMNDGIASNARSGAFPVSAPADVHEFDASLGGMRPGETLPPIPDAVPAIHSVSNRLRGSRSFSASSSSDSSVSLGVGQVGSPTERPIRLRSDTYSSEKRNGPDEPVIRAHESDQQLQADGNELKSVASTAGFSGRYAFEIDIKSISSHAQAEALVQQTQREILEMGEQEISSNDDAPGSIPLSARLAAYGESLALERKLRGEMEGHTNGRPSSSIPSVYDGASRLAPTQSSTDRVIRQHSLDENSGRRGRYRQMYLTPPGALDPYLSVETAKADQPYSRPATSLGTACQPTDSDILDGPLMSDIVSPVDSLEQDLFNSSLYRVSTTPLSGPVVDRSIEQARTVKLTKMGFAPSEQASRLPPTQPKSFGGLSFKNLMQTFKGKS